MRWYCARGWWRWCSTSLQPAARRVPCVGLLMSILTVFVYKTVVIRPSSLRCWALFFIGSIGGDAELGNRLVAA